MEVQPQGKIARVNELIPAEQQHFPRHFQTQLASAHCLYLKNCNMIMLITSCCALDSKR